MHTAAIACALMAILVPTSVSGADPDPVVGSWKLNLSKSRRVGSAGMVRRYAETPSGIRMTETRIDRSGHRSEVQYLIAYDGQESPVLVLAGHALMPARTDETMSFTRIDRYTVHGVSRISGKVAYEFTRQVSMDGRTLTVTIHDTAPQGKSADSVMVYERAGAARRPGSRYAD
jgi:hypothetical protein